ncbi:pentapeptide repeat-containing protein [Flavivirga aquimarina]|uniref:Pentapeptide repeat-containing protein n=1 Tax=Flavivirga aquimarina TaxID=2027862 RepID=A0ABT8W504_9FLAO|nr:pentapeptide repeat-containing protein [Flavivirga aquimarina]MDO5968196.1 pentapeptide repeat-containing protein [Flavivirga aquimarina]
MELQFIEDIKFERKDFSKDKLDKGDYELCTFSNCNFSNSDLSKIRLTECLFIDCNLSLVNLYQTEIQDVTFKDCKMLGLRFDKCSDFAFSIKVDNCQLNHSSFYKKKLPKTVFNKSKLQEVDFTECDLNTSIFDNCDLLNAVFKNTNLQNTDLRSSFNFIIDPENNKIKGAKFSLESVKGLLIKYNIKIE